MHIRTENLTKIFFKGKPNEVVAIKNITLEIKKGEFFAVTGHSGSGKTTLLSLLGLLTTPSSGRVFYDDEEISSYSDGWKTKFRKRHLGVIFQQYNLLSNYLAWENVALPLLCSDTSKNVRKKSALIRKIPSCLRHTHFGHSSLPFLSMLSHIIGLSSREKLKYLKDL